MIKLAPSKNTVHLQRIIAEPPPFVTAKSWAVADGRTGDILFGKGETERHEVASLTKIMTAYTALRLAKQYNVDLEYTRTQVSERAAAINGTTAMLDEGDTLYLWDLFYGMMLPSGNDAAIVIAEFFGAVIKEKVEPSLRTDAIHEGQILKNPSVQKLFVNEMNKIAKQLELSETSFVNPHGLKNMYNKSSACDIAKLASIAMKDPRFRQVVSCRKYSCKAIDRGGEDKEFEWKNTNKLLKKGYNGIKTGITQSAGPCLVTSIETEGSFLIFVLLNSKSMEQRWHENKKLKKWALARLGKIKEFSEAHCALDKKSLIQKLAHV